MFWLMLKAQAIFMAPLYFERMLKKKQNYCTRFAQRHVKFLKSATEL
jgi:hypothetical protein